MSDGRPMGQQSVVTFQRRITVDRSVAIAGGSHAGLRVVCGQGNQSSAVQRGRVSPYTTYRSRDRGEMRQGYVRLGGNKFKVSPYRMKFRTIDYLYLDQKLTPVLARYGRRYGTPINQKK